MNDRLKDTLAHKVADRVPAVRAIGGVDGVRAAADAIDDEVRTVGVQATARELMGSIPALARLLWRLVRDGRTPLHVRLALPLIVAYLASPIDLVPDFIPVVGALDDALLAVFAVRWVLGRVDEDLLRSHWTGTDAMFDVLAGITKPAAPGGSRPSDANETA